jgi:hypothetical protein
MLVHTYLSVTPSYNVGQCFSKLLPSRHTFLDSNLSAAPPLPQHVNIVYELREMFFFYSAAGLFFSKLARYFPLSHQSHQFCDLYLRKNPKFRGTQFEKHWCRHIYYLPYYNTITEIPILPVINMSHPVHLTITHFCCHSWHCYRWRLTCVMDSLLTLLYLTAWH